MQRLLVTSYQLLFSDITFQTFILYTLYFILFTIYFLPFIYYNYLYFNYLVFQNVINIKYKVYDLHIAKSLTHHLKHACFNLFFYAIMQFCNTCHFCILALLR